MEPQFQTSFIPKKPLDAPQGGRVTHKRRVNVLALIASVVFIAALALGVAVFLFKQFLISDIARKSARLTEARETFQPEVIEDLQRLNVRIKEAKRLLERHVAPTALFSLLSEETLRNVRFKDFSYRVGSDGSAELKMDGEARGFSAVALQADRFGELRDVREPIFEDLARDDSSGLATFTFSGVVNSSVFNFKNTLAEAGADGNEGSSADTSTPSDPTAQ